MKIVELILDEDQEYSGIEAISIVERPAIEEDFIALKDEEVNQSMDKILRNLSSKLSAKLRK